MRTKILLTTAILTIAPTLALAMGCSYDLHGQEARMSCAEGTTWDADSGACVPSVSS